MLRFTLEEHELIRAVMTQTILSRLIPSEVSERTDFLKTIFPESITQHTTNKNQR
jgi:hypothetical protein